MTDHDTVLEMLRSHKEQLDRIENKVDKTNGRVRALELWQARVQGSMMVVKWVPSALSGVAAALVVQIVLAASHHA